MEPEMIKVSSNVGKMLDATVTEESKNDAEEKVKDDDDDDDDDIDNSGDDHVNDDDDGDYNSVDYEPESDDTETERDARKTKSKPRCQKIKQDPDSKGSEKRFECDVCKMKFSYKVQLKTHMRSHTGERPYKCSVCKKSFSHNVNLTTHMRLHTGEKPFACDICDRSFTHSNTLKMHMRIHTGERPYRCTVCDECFLRSDQLKRHMTVHTGVKPYNCKFCSRSFTQIDSLKMHMEKHTDDKPYECGVCHKKFASVVTLKRHMRNHDEKNFKCDLCDNKYVFKTELKRHIATRHTAERPFKCSVCEKAFFLSCNLTTHMLAHMGEKPYKCPFCEKQFSSASNMGAHKRLEHTKEGLHPCLKCGREFPQPSALKKHMTTHTGVKKHVCTICSKTFPLSGSLKVHMRTHSADKPFKCTVCQKGFRYRHHLRRHSKIHEYKIVTVSTTEQEDHNGESQCDEASPDQLSSNQAAFSIQSAGISGDSSQDDSEFSLTQVKVEPADPVNQSDISELSLTSETVTYTGNDNDASLVTGLSKQKKISQNGTLSIIVQSRSDDEQFSKPTMNSKPTTTLRLLMEQFQQPQKNTGALKRKLLPKSLSGTQEAGKASIHSQIEAQNSFSGKKPKKSRGDPVKCPVCEKAFIYVKSLDKHMTQHTKVSNFVCKTCGQDFADRSTLKLHATTHNIVNTEPLPEPEDIKPFVCQVCCHIFADISALTNHEKTHNPIQPTAFNCSHCEEQFNNEELLRIHEKIHKKDDCDIKPLPCHECGEAFKTSNALRSHQALVHAPDLSLKLFPCFKCGEKFGDADALKSHAAVHDAPVSQMLSCSKCQQKFMDSVSLKQHEEQHGNQLPQAKQKQLNKAVPTANQSSSESNKITDELISVTAVTNDLGTLSNNHDKQNYPITKSILCGAIPFQHDMDHHGASPTSSTSMTSRKCRTCGETFTNLIALRLHELDHSQIDLTGKR